MTETEYIAVSNLQRLRIVRNIVGSFVAEDGSIATNSRYADWCNQFDKELQRLEKVVKAMTAPV